MADAYRSHFKFLQRDGKQCGYRPLMYFGNPLRFPAEIASSIPFVINIRISINVMDYIILVKLLEE